MSVPNPTGGEREFEALRRAQRAHEPSMEEILASIRAIIADDRVAEPAKPAPTPKPPAPVGPQIVYSKDATPALRAVPEPEPEAAPPRTQNAPAPEAETPQVAWRRPPIEALPLRREAPEPESRRELAEEGVADPDPEAAAVEPPMLSEEADRAVSGSFNALSTSVALQNAERIESLTRELLRPMIKTWLDEHLPSLVERLVRAEIQRVARGSR